MKISYVTIGEAMNVLNWSGLSYNIGNSLIQQGIELDVVENLEVRRNLFGLLKSVCYKSIGQRYVPERDLVAVRALAKHLQPRISASSQLVFSPSSLPLAYLEVNKPKVFYTDATFGGMLGFYHTFDGLCAETIRYGHELERQALESCDMAIFASDWAAKTAIDLYKANPNKVKVVPFGANMAHKYSLAEIKALVRTRKGETCKLLFLGVDWKRKGGDQALAVARELIEMGIPTELHIVGLKEVPVNPLPDYAVFHGFISKQTQEGVGKLETLLETSHFLLVPSQAEAFGIVFCEASSYGLPSIATKVGGITTAIHDNVNGLTFEQEASATEYANYIGSLFTNWNKYEELALSSFNDYSIRLNWEVSGRKINEYLLGLL